VARLTRLRNEKSPCQFTLAGTSGKREEEETFEQKALTPQDLAGLIRADLTELLLAKGREFIH
jgi:hypothetical protein